MGSHAVEEEGYTILPVSWSLIEPFFVNFKSSGDYFPLIEKQEIVGFRKRKMAMSQLVKNDDSETVKSITPYENFIADCAILIRVKDDSIQLSYQPHYFDVIANQENIDRLTLVKGVQYNMQITQKGNPYHLYESFTVQLDNLLNGEPIEIDYHGPKEISIYVITKNR
jgi:hypothetical protein